MEDFFFFNLPLQSPLPGSDKTKQQMGKGKDPESGETEIPGGWEGDSRARGAHTWVGGVRLGSRVKVHAVYIGTGPNVGCVPTLGTQRSNQHRKGPQNSQRTSQSKRRDKANRHCN